MGELRLAAYPVPSVVASPELIDTLRKPPEKLFDRQVGDRRLHTFEEQLRATALPCETALRLGAEDHPAARIEDLHFLPAFAEVEKELHPDVFGRRVVFDDQGGVSGILLLCGSQRSTWQQMLYLLQTTLVGPTCLRKEMTTAIRPAEFPRDLVEVRNLFREYAQGLGIDLDFQGFETEVAQLPGKYQGPAGRLCLAWSGTETVGCVALRPLSGSSCEMKRLYVRPQARGEQLGRRLAEYICKEAREAGYSRICLDTLPTMGAAQKLYQSLGFLPTEPYVFNPIPGTKYLALDL